MSARARLQKAGVGAAELAAVDREVEQQIDDAVGFAEGAHEPPVSTLLDFVTTPREPGVEPPLVDSGEEFRTMDAVREAIEVEMGEDPTVLMAGIDLEAGNVFGLFRGLADRFPGRVRNTPISESALIGSAVGAAMRGLRPVVELMYLDFLGVCFDQLLNQAAKQRFMTGGAVQIPLVIRTQFGAGRSSGSQHSQSLEALLAHIPGLSVVMPSSPAEAYGLLRGAIRDPNPVVFIENRLTYGQRGPRPDPGYVLPLGRARVVRPGSDVTIVSYSRMVTEACAAAEELERSDISAEVIDLRTVSPLDRETVLASVSRTHRLVVAHEAVRDFGVGAELAALAADEGFWDLDAPVIRVGAALSPAPYAPNLERAWLPDRHDIVDAVVRSTATTVPR